MRAWLVAAPIFIATGTHASWIEAWSEAASDWYVDPATIRSGERYRKVWQITDYNALAIVAGLNAKTRPAIGRGSSATPELAS